MSAAGQTGGWAPYDFPRKLAVIFRCRLALTGARWMDIVQCRCPLTRLFAALLCTAVYGWDACTTRLFSVSLALYYSDGHTKCMWHKRLHFNSHKWKYCNQSISPNFEAIKNGMNEYKMYMKSNTWDINKEWEEKLLNYTKHKSLRIAADITT